MQVQEPLSKFNVFKSSDIAESEAVLSRTLCPHVLVAPSGGAVETIQNIARLQQSDLVYVRYGIPVQVAKASIEDYYLFIVPQDGRCVIHVEGVEVSGVRGSGCLISAGHGFRIDSDETASSLIWRVKRRAFEDCARSVMGQDFDNPIAFMPAVRLDRGAASGIGRTLDFMVAELGVDDNVFQSTHALERLEQSLMHAIIALQPSNINHAATPGHGTIAPRCVRRVEEYINANAGEEILLSDLVSISGVCGRTLFRNFRQFRDVSPMEYLRQTRIRLVRQSLLQSDGAEAVTSVLMKWGITQFGRFAADYRKQYGELPSETLRTVKAKH
jgi:AraC-like DNA-binding protein